MAALPELRVAKAAFWSALATELVRAGVQDVPTELTVSEDLHGTWQHPNLLFSQTCGYPLVLGLDEHVQLVATPVYTAQGCVGANYSSAVVVRDGDTATSLEDLRGRRCAFNSVDSQADTFFSEVVETGGHLASLTAVVQGRADVAAIDCVGFASMRKYRPELTQRVRVLFFTDSAPGLPFITSRSTSPVELVLMRKALGTVFKSHSLETTRTTLLLKNVEVVSRDTYTLLTEMETEAVALGYPRLA